MLDNIKTIERRAEVDAVQNHLCHKGVVDAGALEDNRSVVEKVVRACTLLASPVASRPVKPTSKLLEHLDQDTKHDAISHLGGREHVNPTLISA